MITQTCLASKPCQNLIKNIW